MIKYAKIINEETKQCEVGTGTNAEFYQSIGMTEMEVEQAWNGAWFVQGYAPEKPEPLVKAERIAELKAQLDSTDYVIIKIAEADTTEEQAQLREHYAEVITNRKAWRTEINELEGE